jgi:hypothetical protein
MRFLPFTKYLFYCLIGCHGRRISGIDSISVGTTAGKLNISSSPGACKSA